MTERSERAEQAERAGQAKQARRGRAPFVSLIAAATVSNTGTGAHFVAIAWFVLVTSGSAARTGGISAVGMLGLAGGSLLGGLIVDRIGPKATSVGFDVAAAVAVALIPLLYAAHVLSYWQLALLAFLGGVLDMPGATARQVMLPEIAGSAGTSLEMANSWMQLATNGAFLLLGPLAAGLLIPALGPVNVLLLDAASYLVSAATVALAIPDRRPRPSGRRPVGTTGAGDGRMRGGTLRAALRFIASRGRLLAVLTVAGLLSLLVSGLVTVVVPVIGRRRFDDPRALSAMVWGLGVGLTIGFLGLGLARRRLSCDALLRLSFGAMSAMLWLLTVSHLLLLDVVALALFGVGVGLLIPLAYALAQRMVPEEMLGTVLGISSAAVFLAAPLGSVLAGAALAWLSLPVVIAICAAAMTVTGLWAMLDPRLRGLDRVLDPAATPSDELVNS